jgi:predicted small secreted protein
MTSSKEQTMMKSLVAMLVLGGMLTMAGCNTMRGMGQDMSTAGEKIENSAERNK